MPSPPTEFGKLVRKRRVATGLTQAELAESAGVSERTISDLERGVRATVYPATARSLAAALRVGDGDLEAFLAAARAGPDWRADRLASPFPDLRSNVPVPLTPLVGRETEVTITTGLVRDPQARMITLIGPGGIGKSRLAVEIALLTRDDFPGGSFFVDLSTTDDPAMLLPLLATAIGVRPDTGGLERSLAERLNASALLVLDTFEHLVAAAPAVANLLAACPDLTVIATSRAALRLRGEREVPLLPLPVRGPGLPGAELSAAVELFLDRAAAVAPATACDVETVRLVTDICARVDGLPLAIELAAARVKHMPLADLLGQLEHRLDALVGGARDLPPRQQTMRAALQWSYELLDPMHQRLFRALAIFRGTFGRDAAQGVSASRDSADASELLAAISGLVDSSLVFIETGASGKARYRLLDVIREYALERAAERDEVDELRRRHAAHFVTIAERAEPKLRGAEQREWYSRLAVDEGNFRAAMAWALQAGEPEVALRLAASLWMFWRWAGLFAEGRAWLDAALEAGGACPLNVRCQALWGAGWLAFHQGDYERMGQLGVQMSRMLGPDDDALLGRNALTLVGNGALGEGRSQESDRSAR